LIKGGGRTEVEKGGRDHEVGLGGKKHGELRERDARSKRTKDNHLNEIFRKREILRRTRRRGTNEERREPRSKEGAPAREKKTKKDFGCRGESEKPHTKRGQEKTKKNRIKI